MADCLIGKNLSADDFLTNQIDDKISLPSLNTKNQSTQKIPSKLISGCNELNQFKYIFQKFQSIIFYLKDEKINYHNILFLFIFSFLLLIIFIDKKKADKRKIMAYYDSLYQIEITKYNILYDINNDSSMNVTENITISYQGVRNTGFMRYIPVDNGVQIRKVRIYQITENGIQKVYHRIYSLGSSLVFDIGDYQIKYGKNESYFITYEFRILSKEFQKKNMMPLNVVGHNWQCKINNIFVQLNVPSGFEEAKCYVGPYGTTKEFPNFSIKKKKIISLFVDHLNVFEGVTFNLHFASKAINSYTDSSCFNYIIITSLILLVIVALGFNAHYKNKIVPVRYTSALNTLDPLIMSKVVNGRVKKSDVPSIIFYWASKGYLNINFDDENDPVLIKNEASLPDSFPTYQKYMFDKLFKNGDVVNTLDLKYKFYETINIVINMVETQTNAFDNGNSVILSLLFAALSSIWLILAPLKIQKMISEDFKLDCPLFVFGFIQLFIWIVRYLISFHYILSSEYIFKMLLVGIVCFFQCYLYMSNVPTFIISDENKLALCILSEICVFCSTYMITKNAYFKAKINEVFGFKDFIEHPVNEEFESFVKKDPELFYNFICYAQVLDMTNKWKHKFDSLTVSPPHWIVYSSYDSYRYNDYYWMHRRIMIMNNSMVNNMVNSPPQESSHSFRSSHSHGGGGFGGGGFGGGGGCGR